MTINNQTLFRLQSRVGSISPAERASIVSGHINSLITNPFISVSALDLVDSLDTTDIMAGDQVLVSVTDADAAAAGRDRYELAVAWQLIIEKAIREGKAAYSIRSIILGVIEALVACVVLVILVRWTNRLYRRATLALEAGPSDQVRWRGLRELNVYQSGLLNRFLRSALRWLRALFWVGLALVFVPLLFSFFPWTRVLVAQLIAYVLQPLATMWESVVAYLPNLFFLVTIAIFTWVAIRIVGLVFLEIERQTIRLSGFDPDWAPFTAKIVDFLVIVAAVVIAFPYLPGSESPALRGMTIFLGALVSLSSTSAISNIVAGVIQTYTGAFRIGDVICIEDKVGEVVAKTLLVMRIRTWKNEIVSVPNSQALNHDVINYTALAKTTGLLLHTAVTIGYDAPWRQVHDLMIAAGKKTPGVLPEPEPFVLQTGLNDYNVAYELNVYTDQPGRIPSIYSALHQNIQDTFNEAGVEIMSPSYSALRDGNAITIPQDYLPKSYRAPGFRVNGNPQDEQDSGQPEVLQSGR